MREPTHRQIGRPTIDRCSGARSWFARWTPFHEKRISEESPAHDVARDPFVREVLGDHAEPLERPGISPLRLGGEATTHGERFLVLGDAAGQTDPLTGEGIHTAMVAAKIAARVLHEAFAEGDLSAKRLGAYQATAAQRHGAGFMDDFGAAMTGVKPKSLFLAPRMALPLGAALIKLSLSR